MQKSPFLPTSQDVPIVQFSKLDENNKAQFLEFLIKNNITFDNAPGKQNVLAKVTLKTLTPNKTLINKNNNDQNVKKGNKKNMQKSSLFKIENKQNVQHYHANKKPIKSSKTPVKNVLNSKNEKKPTQTTQFFKKVKLIYQQDQKQKKLLPQNVRDSSITLKSQRKDSNKNCQTMNIQLREKINDRKNLTLISPAKSGRKMDEKSSERLISIKDSNISPLKSTRNVSFTKQSHQRLSNFKKENIPKTMRQSSLLKESRGPIYIAKQAVNQRQKVRNKVSASKINESKESISFSKQKGFFPKETLRNQSFQSLNRIQLVNKYKEYFNIFNNGNSSKSPVNGCTRQRPVCWPLTQIERLFDEFYDNNFIKNTNQILNENRRLNESLKKESNSKTSHLAESLQKFLNRKFNKVQKAIEYNLVNILYSVAYYINEFKQSQDSEENGSILELNLFEDFLTKYKLEDYLFFLFCRNILKQDFKKSFVPSSMTVNINKKEIDRFLKHIVGQNNTEILNQYHQMIFQKIPNYEIEINKFMKILIEDYKMKRQAAEQSHRQRVKNKKEFEENDMEGNDFQCDEESSLENTFNKILGYDNQNDPKRNIFENSGQLVRQDSMQELTFGEDTKDMLRQVDIMEGNNNKNNETVIQKQDFEFWQSSYINEKNIKSEKQRLLKDEFNQMIAQKLCQKTHELVELLSSTSTAANDFYRSKHHCLQQQSGMDDECNSNNNQHNDTYEENQCQQIEELLFSKALCLFFTVIEMNKVKWLKELYIVNPSQEDIEKVEQIQLYFRKIKQFPSAKDIAEFCKLILTVNQITEELSKFFI